MKSPALTERSLRLSRVEACTFIRRLAMRCLRSLLLAVAIFFAWAPLSQAQPAVGTLYATDGTFLYVVSGGSASQIGQLDNPIYQIAWHNGVLYGLSASGYLYVINPFTAAGSLIGDTGILTNKGLSVTGLAFSNGLLYTQAINYSGASTLYAI